MRYCYDWPPYTGEYPWDPEAVRAVAAAETWCSNNLSEKAWSIKKRTGDNGMIYIRFWFQKKEDLVLFKMVCR